MHWPAPLKSCRTRPSPAIRSNSCRSTPPPQAACRGFARSAFRRDRSRKNSTRCSSKANERTARAGPALFARPPEGRVLGTLRRPAFKDTLAALVHHHHEVRLAEIAALAQFSGEAVGLIDGFI